MSTNNGNGHTKELLLKLALAIAGSALMLLVAVVGFIGREGLKKMDVLSEKIESLAKGVNDNRSDIKVLEFKYDRLERLNKVGGGN